MHAIEQKLDRTFGKDDLRTRAFKFIDKKEYDGFRANILTSKAVFEGLGLNGEGFYGKAVQASAEVQSKKEDIKNALSGNNEQDGWKNIRGFLNSWVGEHCYKRAENYKPNPHCENKYNEITKGYSLETTLFNKVYEMMCADLILAHAQEKNPNHTIQVYKTSTYDDIMSGVDAIAVATDKASGKKKTFFLDILTSASETSRYSKNDKGRDTIQCFEYNSSIGRNVSANKEDKIIYTIHPELGFMALNTYIKTIKEKGSITPAELLSVYRKLHAEHQEFETIDNEREIPIISSTQRSNAA